VGAAAAEGKSLAELAAIGKAAVASLATMGVSFSAGTSPAVGKPSFELGEHEMELGLGIHGEPGVKRTELQPADELTETLLNRNSAAGKVWRSAARGGDGEQSGSNHRNGARDCGPPCR
jgi:dihydroxyacetone kinase